MKSGRLRHRVTIQRLIQGQEDGLGGTTQRWEGITSVWARVTPLNGNEMAIAQQIQPSTTHRVEMRYRKGVTSHMRLLFQGRRLEILSVQNIEELQKEIHLLCKEVGMDELSQ
ncbi:phage head closure protein [Thermoactinomyces sp. DSM 45892]|uniref:phage head closure protein n=1 Tax=Thermoactinomyces sp. DSM 45892 TaxID=1882753 RepID=UPI00089D05D4|nr:phage head closure protein [Thermoactinomyces sp. DSM 45892]SDY23100.1 phage head-tail adaptor, putative, SPP1 family [Thermoactinomyces sp. DSM 45892]